MLEHHYFNYESLVPSFFLLQTELQKKQMKIMFLLNQALNGILAIIRSALVQEPPNL